jgi:hypothetical protein
MHMALAYADSGDSGASNLVKVFGGLVILAVVAVLAAISIGVSRARRHPQAEAIVVITLLWGLITAGSLMYAGESQYEWSKEYTTRIESGYYDPRDTSDKPQLPWALWCGLGFAYAAMLAWSLSFKPSDLP